MENNRRGLILENILEILKSQALTTAEMFEIFSSGYVGSYKKMRKFIKYGTIHPMPKFNYEYKNRQNLYSFLNKLKNQGLIERSRFENNGKFFWKIAKKGFSKLDLLKQQSKFKKNVLNYKKEPDDKFKVIIFDIPEKERHKRHWLRLALVSLDFSLLQQSVWFGRGKIPEQFIQDMQEHEMLSYVHIFEISKKGTIERLS